MSEVTQHLNSSSETPLRREPLSTRVEHSEIGVRGKNVVVPSVQIGERSVITTGKWLRVAAVRHEDLVEGDTIADPDSFISQLKKSGLKADLYTFAQRLPNSTPKYTYHKE